MLTSLTLLSLLVACANAHGVLVAIAGANGVQGQGFGVVPTTPRDGTKNKPFQTDTSVFKANAGACGKTAAGGEVDIATNTAAAVAAGVPSMDSDGTVTMTIHQVNGDGAGPYTCGVSADATGASFVDITVTANVPGQNSRSNAKATDFPLVAAVPAGTTCTGEGGTCLIRCMNAARMSSSSVILFEERVTNSAFNSTLVPLAAAPAVAAPAAAAPASSASAAAAPKSATAQDAAARLVRRTRSGRRALQAQDASDSELVEELSADLADEEVAGFDAPLTAEGAAMVAEDIESEAEEDAEFEAED